MILGSHQFFLYKTHINISHIYYPNILYVIGPSQIVLTQAHKLPWAFSQILPIIAHILSNLGFYKNTHHITTKIGPQNYIIATQSPTSFGLWAKPKESPKFQKSHYDVANSKSPTTMWLIRSPTTIWLIPKSPTTMWLIPKVPLRCGTFNACYDVALFKKPVAIRHL